MRVGMNRLGETTQLGFTLIEVLVTMLIFSLGLLGCAGLQSRAQKSQHEVYQRVYAIDMLRTMLANISANSDARGCYQLGGTELGVGYTQAYKCTSHGSAEAQQQAADNINQWSALLQGGHTTNGENNIGGLLNGRGCVEFDSASNRYIVTVVWQGLTEASATDSRCGEGNYGGAGNRLRRLVSGTFYAPDLAG